MSDTHREHGVCVKVYANHVPASAGHLSETTIQLIYEDCRERFWDDLNWMAKDEELCDKVYAEGRMGGWAVPDPIILDTERYIAFARLCDELLDFYTDEFKNACIDAATDETHIERGYN